MAFSKAYVDPPGSVPLMLKHAVLSQDHWSVGSSLLETSRELGVLNAMPATLV